MIFKDIRSTDLLDLARFSKASVLVHVHILIQLVIGMLEKDLFNV